MWSFAIAGPAPAGDTAASAGPAEPQERLLWTREPVRVDPKAQTLPRLPDRASDHPFPQSLFLPRSVRVTDSVSFAFGDTRYRLSGLDPVPPAQVCLEEQGQRMACGLRARMTLRTLIAGRLLRCRTVLPAENDMAENDVSDNDAMKVDCVQGVQRLAEALVSAGHAFVADPVRYPDLDSLEKTARNDQRGVWADPQIRGARPERHTAQ
ncbi:hypothetical protein GCM10011316_34780 [Roseibium aquae]|uniref:TNase-like domain-containing protein n=1 Tax=Roseibium aquae TaxID=1323746 RepID=A0A916X1W1_9HYPH|nr:hypothetical protein [Roseibium aquae]GGB59773.1 hypothetical protein GCM10011316_34780 [Roseibium aquae]